MVETFMYGLVVLVVTVSLMIGGRVAGAQNRGFLVCLAVAVASWFISSVLSALLAWLPFIALIVPLVVPVILVKWILQTSTVGAMMVGLVAAGVKFGALVLLSRFA